MAKTILILAIGILTLPAGGGTLTKGESGTKEDWIKVLGSAETFEYHRAQGHFEIQDGTTTLPTGDAGATGEPATPPALTKRDIAAELIKLGDTRTEDALMKLNHAQLSEFLAVAKANATPEAPDPTGDAGATGEPATPPAE